MAKRQQWRSKLGFILAASGSAIGLGNIVFFSANAYRFGAGAFYLPYLLALLVIGIPVMIVEFGLGQHTRSAFPQALGRIAGRGGELVGWFAILNSLIITMYYVTILAWAAGMWWSALLGSLFEPSVAVEGFGMAAGEMNNPHATFFDLLSQWSTVGFVLFVWVLNILSVYRGTTSIERAVTVMVPFVWVAMILFIIRGLTLPGGVHGVYLLFTPDFQVMSDPAVWNGAFSQIFFTLSLGFGIMTAYSSYLPKGVDRTSNAVVISMMNCSFELIAGIAVFSLLFAFAMVPQASTLSMMFFIIPEAIESLPTGTKIAGVGFFTLLVLAGLSSSISLLEAGVAAVVDKFQVRRGAVLAVFATFGILGSVVFALPQVIDPELSSNGTVGLTLLDLFDHYAFNFGLVLVGLAECLLIGWAMPVSRLRETLNAHSSLKLPASFDLLIRYVIPLALFSVTLYALLDDLGVVGDGRDGSLHVYGDDYVLGGLSLAPYLAPLLWLGFTLVGGWILASRPPAARAPEPGSGDAGGEAE